MLRIVVSRVVLPVGLALVSCFGVVEAAELMGGAEVVEATSLTLHPWYLTAPRPAL